MSEIRRVMPGSDPAAALLPRVMREGIIPPPPIDWVEDEDDHDDAGGCFDSDDGTIRIGRGGLEPGNVKGLALCYAFWLCKQGKLNDDQIVSLVEEYCW